MATTLVPSRHHPVWFRNLTSSTKSTDAADVTTASVTPKPNALILAGFTFLRGSSTNPTAPSAVSGAGITFTALTSVNLWTGFPTNRATLYLYYGMTSTPSTGTITATGSFTYLAAAWAIVEVYNVDTSGVNGLGAIVQTVTDSANTAGLPPHNLSPSLAAFGSNRNATMAWGGAQGATTGHNFSNLTLVTTQNIADSGSRANVGVGFSASEVNTPAFTWDETANIGSWGAIGLEIKARGE